MSTFSRPTTPIRRSATLNNPEAYPSPESARRNILSQQPTTPPRSPFRRSPSVITPESFVDDPAPGDDEEMDVDVEVTPSTDLLLAPVDFHEVGSSDYQPSPFADFGRHSPGMPS